jgi:hypothetical protein
MKLLTLLICWFAFAAFAIQFYRLAVRGLLLYVRFRFEGRLLGADQIGKQNRGGIQLYVLRDVWVFNVFAYPLADGDEKRVSPQRLMAVGIMVNRLYSTKKYLRRKFPNVEVMDSTLTTFD